MHEYSLAIGCSSHERRRTCAALSGTGLRSRRTLPVHATAFMWPRAQLHLLVVLSDGESMTVDLHWGRRLCRRRNRLTFGPTLWLLIASLHLRVWAIKRWLLRAVYFRLDEEPTALGFRRQGRELSDGLGQRRRIWARTRFWRVS